MQVRKVEWTAADGTRLAAAVRGPDASADLPVLCLPGLTRNGRDFAPLAEALAGDGNRPRRVIAMDFRGRGLSAWADPATYRVDVEAADVVAGLDALGISTAAVVGTSRGGLVAMVMAATAGDRLGPVVLNDIGPVIELAGLLAIRDRMQVLIGETHHDWSAVVEDFRRSLADRFPHFTADDWLRLAHQTHREDDEGRPVLDYDPALYTAFAGFDPQAGLPALWELFDAFGRRPLLAIRGEHSDILSEETLAAMQARLPQMAVHRVPDEGHAPMLWDAPSIARIRRFLDEAA